MNKKLLDGKINYIIIIITVINEIERTHRKNI